MTDREAIKRLAEIVANLAARDEYHEALAAVNTLERDLADPAAPTVTREQALAVREALRWVQQYPYGPRREPLDDIDINDPATFRAVADALEGDK